MQIDTERRRLRGASEIDSPEDTHSIEKKSVPAPGTNREATDDTPVAADREESRRFRAREIDLCELLPLRARQDIQQSNEYE